MKQKAEKEVMEKKKEEERKKKMDMVLERERERREAEKKFKEKLLTIQNSEPYQAVYKKHSKPLKHVFEYYKEDPATEVLNFPGFMHFASQLNVFPALLNPEELNLIFRSLTRDKNKAEMGLKYDEFQQALLRIAIKAKVTLNKVHDRYASQIAQQSQVEQSEMKKMIDDERRGLGEQPLNEEQEQQLKERVNFEENLVDRERDDIYHKIEEATPETLEALIFYLDLPADKKLLSEKLKALRKENAKFLAPRDKKRAAGKGGLNDSFEAGTGSLKFVSPRQHSKSPGRDASARNNPASGKQSERLETVNYNELAKQPEAKVENIRNPQGQVESWKVQNTQGQNAQGQYGQGQYNQGQNVQGGGGQYGQYNQGQSPQGQYNQEQLGQGQINNQAQTAQVQELLNTVNTQEQPKKKKMFGLF